jgi:hypothetical protein
LGVEDASPQPVTHTRQPATRKTDAAFFAIMDKHIVDTFAEGV